MKGQSSIKWRPIWKAWLPLILFLAPLILEDQIAGTLFTPYVYGILVTVVGIIYFRRFRLWQAFVIMLGTAVAIWTYFLAARPEQTQYTFQLIGLDPGKYFVPWIQTYWPVPAWLAVLVVNTFIFYSLGPRLIKALALEGSAIRLFKLAAREVSGERNGFTGRPFQAGEHSYARNEIIGLASFLEGKNICVADFPDNGIKLIFSMGISPQNTAYRNELSYVFFADDGKLTVFISQNDYKQYKKEYTFDQLCELMGNTFLRFAQYYSEHLEKRITTELKSV